MPVSGFSEFKAHLPDFSVKQAKLVVARLGTVTIFSLLISLGLDFLMRFWYVFYPNELFKIIELWIPIFIPLVLILGGIRTAQIGFLRKNALIQKYQAQAYQKVVKYIFTGIPIVFGGLFYNYLPHSNFWFLTGEEIGPINQLTTLFSRSLFAIWFGISWDIIPRYIIGLTMVILAICTAIRAVKDFGVDNAGLVYLYYPEEARVVQSDIYSIVRHPMYMAAMMISIGGVCFRLSIYSIIHLIIATLGFTYHILCVEEKELIERLGNSYKDYQKKVPAIFVKPKNWVRYCNFLFKIRKKE